MLAVTLVAVLNVAGVGAAPSVVDHAARTYLSQVPDAPPPPPVQPVRSLFEVNRELQTLERSRPGLGFPIAFIAIGGAITLLEGLILLSITYLGGGSIFFSLWPVAVVFAVIALAGFLGTGVMVLGFRLHKRKQTDARIAELQAELDRRQGEHPYHLQPGYEMPPPPPPPPPPVGFAPAPVPQFVLAQF